MTSFSKLHKLQREVIFPVPAAAPETAATDAPRLLRRGPAPELHQELLVQGQGTFIFKYLGDPTTDALAPLRVSLRTAEGHKVLQLEMDATHTRLLIGEREAATSATGIVADGYAYYWLSLDTINNQVRCGIGEARLETQLLAAALSPDERKSCQAATAVYYAPPVEPMRLLRDPIVTTVPLEVRGTDRLTMNDVALNRYLPQAALPAACRQLYDTIAGPLFELDADDFPEFSRAIKYSIETEGCWCFEKLAEKQKKSSVQHQVYLRITLGHNGGESPGIPFVMEIWPPQCFSSVHQHAGANAVIRVLHGRIQVTMFPYLRPDATLPFGRRDFEQGAITWISPLLNQVHRLRNTEPLGGKPCITIQCYQYDADDAGHYPFFDYSKNDELHQYEPDSDLDFVLFKEQMRTEWNNWQRPPFPAAIQPVVA